MVSKLLFPLILNQSSEWKIETTSIYEYFTSIGGFTFKVVIVIQYFLVDSLIICPIKCRRFKMILREG